MQNEKGFTLVEMLVTISILLLIMAIFPFLKPSRQLVFTCETEKLHSFLLQAQMKAMFTKKACTSNFKQMVYKRERSFLYMTICTVREKRFITLNKEPFHKPKQSLARYKIRKNHRVATRQRRY